MLMRVLTILICALCAASAFAQSSGVDASKRSASDRGDDRMAPSEGMLEMQFRWKVRAAEKEYNEILERSRDVLETSQALKAAFEQNNRFASADVEKLQPLEKQIKKIRKSLGGDDDEELSAEAQPSSLADALAKFHEISRSLNEQLKKSTRHQISASSIENANQMLDLVIYLRAHGK